MPTLAQVRTAVDNRLANLWTNQIVPRQDLYFAANGKYWQGILTNDISSLPNVLDADGSTPEISPILTRKPTDQAENWTASGINLGGTLPMVLRIDTYDGPSGKGYVAQVYVKHNGIVYTRAQNNGPETWRTFAWKILPPSL